RIGKRHFRLLTSVSFAVCATLSFSAANAQPRQCVVSSVPLQVRSEGLTERLGDIVLQCSGSAAGTVLSSNVTLFFPVSVTNRVDANNLTHDAIISIDSGGGYVPTAVAGQIANALIAFNGISIPVPAGGAFNPKVST